jgi:hypothetical protein
LPCVQCIADGPDLEGGGQHQHGDQENLELVGHDPFDQYVDVHAAVIEGLESARPHGRQDDAFAQQVVIVEYDDGVGWLAFSLRRHRRQHPVDQILADAAGHVDLREGDPAGVPFLPQVFQGRHDQSFDDGHRMLLPRCLLKHRFNLRAIKVLQGSCEFV